MKALTIEIFVAVTVILHTMAFLLSCINKACHNKWLRLSSWACYLLVPILVVYTFGLMGESDEIEEHPTSYFTWGIMLLITYSSLDNLICFRPDETNSRLNLLVQYLVKGYILVFLFNHIHSIPKAFVIVAVISLFLTKLYARIGSMGLACGASPWIRGWVRRTVDHMNETMDVEDVEVDPVSMKGVKYMVGVRFSKMSSSRRLIEDGMTVEKIWGCSGEVLTSEDQDGQLKDTCLSYALFWLILGRFWGHPLYQGRGSKVNAWKLVYNWLVAQGAHERVFRIIEVELSFLNDFFYSNYMFHHRWGFHFKLFELVIVSSVAPFVIYMKVREYKGFHRIDRTRISLLTYTMLRLIYVLEFMQFLLYAVSKWVKVDMLCRYVDRGMSNRSSGATAVRYLCRTSLFFSNRLFKPWRRKLDQYSLLEAYSSWGASKGCLGYIPTSFGIPIIEPGKKMGSSVVLCDDVKRAVIQTLSMYPGGPYLAKGLVSLRRYHIHYVFDWSFISKSCAETILLWHVATGLCEINPDSRQDRSQANFKVATKLSRYCAYLLFFSPKLLPVPEMQAEFMCESVICEARRVLRKRRDTEGLSVYNTLVAHCRRVSVNNEGNMDATPLQDGVKLGLELITSIADEGRRWKILADFWAEMILFLAPSNSNGMVHAEKLAEGGEFITHLWALLIHAGVVDRKDMAD